MFVVLMATSSNSVQSWTGAPNSSAGLTEVLRHWLTHQNIWKKPKAPAEKTPGKNAQEAGFLLFHRLLYKLRQVTHMLRGWHCGKANHNPVSLVQEPAQGKHNQQP